MGSWKFIVPLLALTGCLGEFPAAPSFDRGGGLDMARADAARDGSRPDALPGDRGGPPDADRPRDAALDEDAARPPVDAGDRDAAASDASPPDAAPPDAAPVDAVVVPDGCMPVEEQCNGLDDDCNGRVDDLPVLQSPCAVPGRDCTGALRCDVALQAVVCEPIPGIQEVCDGDDQDCDGLVDEDAVDAQGPCSVGLGACLTVGDLGCVGGRLACSAQPGEPSPELCNRIDDDCNGEIDDAAGVGDACRSGVGACATVGELICRDGNLAPVCGAVPGPPAAEICNGEDDNCDGLIDNVQGAGVACSEGLGACRRNGQTICQNGRLQCNAQPGPSVDESCNAVDDDCDGRTDEGPVCVEHALRFCKGWLGWASPAAPQVPVAAWGAGPFCPPSESVQNGSDRCVASPGDQELRPLSLGMPPGEPLDADDALGLAFSCDGGPAGVSEWIQSHCKLYLAFAPPMVQGIERLDPAACPPSQGQVIDQAERARPRCVATGSQGLFHPLWLNGTALAGATFAVALRCDDAAEPERARGLDQSLALTLAFTQVDRCLAGADVQVNGWGACGGIIAGEHDRCVSSGGDRGFHSFTLGNDEAGDVIAYGCQALFGIGLTRAR